MSSVFEKDQKYKRNLDTSDLFTSDLDTNINNDSMADEEFHPLVKIATSLFMGAMFGISIEKARVFEPRIIRQQMVFQNFSMLKVFLTASATSMMIFTLLAMIPSTRKTLEQVRCSFTQGLSQKTLLATTLGSFITGIGMTLAGSCPGMVLAQLGAIVPNAVYVLFGGFTGVLLYAAVHPLLPKTLLKEEEEKCTRMNEYFGTPYFILTPPVAACMGVVVFACEEFFPWTTEVSQAAGSGMLGLLSWPPYVCGLFIGLNQLLCASIIGNSIGSSSAYTTALAQVLVLFPARNSKLAYLRPYASGMENWWQVFYAVGAICGAYMSASGSNSLGSVNGVEPWVGFLGGVAMLFGSRLANGCTSGHGISGMSLLFLNSVVAVPAIFGGAIATACVMKYGLSIPDIPLAQIPSGQI